MIASCVESTNYEIRSGLRGRISEAVILRSHRVCESHAGFPGCQWLGGCHWRQCKGDHGQPSNANHSARSRCVSGHSETKESEHVSPSLVWNPTLEHHLTLTPSGLRFSPADDGWPTMLLVPIAYLEERCSSLSP
jgi:hypothetical protein